MSILNSKVVQTIMKDKDRANIMIRNNDVYVFDNNLKKSAGEKVIQPCETKKKDWNNALVQHTIRKDDNKDDYHQNINSFTTMIKTKKINK